MAILIKEIFSTEDFNTLVTKLNFNFDQLTAHGGGPPGQQGLIGQQGPSNAPGLPGNFWHITNDIDNFYASNPSISHNDLLLLTEDNMFNSINYKKGDIFRLTIVGLTVITTLIGNIKPDNIYNGGGSSIFETIINGTDKFYHRLIDQVDNVPVILSTYDTVNNTNAVLTLLQNHIISNSNNKSALYIYGTDSGIGGGRLTFLYGSGSGTMSINEIINAPHIKSYITSDELSLSINSHHNIKNIFNDNYFIMNDTGEVIYKIEKNGTGKYNIINSLINSNDSFSVNNTTNDIIKIIKTRFDINTYTAFNTTDAVKLPYGTTVQRPTSNLNGHIRYNKDIKAIEAFINYKWIRQDGVFNELLTTSVTTNAAGNKILVITNNVNNMTFLPTGDTDVHENILITKDNSGVMFNNTPGYGNGNQLVNPISNIEYSKRLLSDYREGIVNKVHIHSSNGKYGFKTLLDEEIPNYKTNILHYTKIGNMVHINIIIDFTISGDRDSTASVPLSVVNLPFTAKLDTQLLINIEGAYTFDRTAISTLTNTDTVERFSCEVIENTNTIKIYQVGYNPTIGLQKYDYNTDNLNNYYLGQQIKISGSYMTNEESFNYNQLTAINVPTVSTGGGGLGS